MMGQGKDGGAGKTCCVVVFCLLATIIAIVTIVNLAVSVKSYSDIQDNSKGTVDMKYDSEIWTIQMDPQLNQKRLYVDAKSRELRGYIVDLTNAVCRIAGKNCQIVDSSYSNCWTQGSGGAGILDKWFDVCAGLSVSRDRARSFKFTAPFSPTSVPVFVTLSNNPGNFDPNNLEGRKIGFLSGWWADKNCLFYSTDTELEESEIATLGNIEAAISALMKNEVHAIFVSKSIKALDNSKLKIFEDLKPCLKGGDSIMMRKDSVFKTWWDTAFDSLIKSSAYKEICMAIDDPKVHGNIPGGTAATMCLKEN